MAKDVIYYGLLSYRYGNYLHFGRVRLCLRLRRHETIKRITWISLIYMPVSWAKGRRNPRRYRLGWCPGTAALRRGSCPTQRI